MTFILKGLFVWRFWSSMKDDTFVLWDEGDG